MGSPPKSIDEALDRLAAVLGPIPELSGGAVHIKPSKRVLVEIPKEAVKTQKKVIKSIVNVKDGKR